MSDGSKVPRHGEKLRKIASDAVNYVYNHGNGFARGKEPHFSRREELGRRFRKKYSSFVPEAKEDVQGNVQPTFIGVFDTVAALGNVVVGYLIIVGLVLVLGLLAFSLYASWHWAILKPLIGLLSLISYWYVKLRWSQFKFFSPDPEKRLKISNPRDWWSIWKNGHRAVWDHKNYDKWLDSDVRFARHALAIDEQRKDFPRVKWAMRAEAEKTVGRKPEWLKQVWFAGCHSDIGGSYLEPESRLSDISLDWMMKELQECIPEIQINEDLLVRSPDPSGLQHEETFMFKFGAFKRRWNVKPRVVDRFFKLHPSVLERLDAKAVPQVGDVKLYRPEQLKDHPEAEKYYK